MVIHACLSMLDRIDLDGATIKIERNKHNDYITIVNKDGVYVCSEYKDYFMLNNDKYNLKNAYQRLIEVVKRKL